MKVAFIIDSSGSISNDLQSLDNVFVVDLSVSWDNKSYSDTSDEGLMKQFYFELSEKDILPTTSQPEPSKIVAAYKTIIDQGYDTVIAITLSSSLSGTFSTIKMISQEFAQEITTYMIDSKGTSYVMERQLILALDLINQGKGIDEIVDSLTWFAQHASIYVVIRNLGNLVKGGRLSSASAFLGSRLKIFPLLKFNDEGNIEVFDKVRTMKKVYQRYLKIIDQAIEKFPAGIDVAFAHGDCEAEVEVIKGMILEKYPNMKFRIGYLTPVLGSHGGPGSLGIGILPNLANK